jgi:hypothetical protein
MTAPGTQRFTYLQIGKETVAGTTVATTRCLYPDGTGIINIDPQLAMHGGNRATRTSLAYATSQGLSVDLAFRSHPDRPCAYDELIYPFSQLKGGVTGVGAGADKTWTYAPSQTGANAQESFTFEFGDDVQGWKGGYGQMSDWTLAAAKGGLTSLQFNAFVQQATKATKTVVAANQGVQIPGKLWKWRFAAAQAGLAGASDKTTDAPVDFTLAVQTGIIRRDYMTGQLYFDQTVEGQDLKADLTFHVESTAFTISEFYDKWNTGGSPTTDFIQMKAVGPTLGSSNYSAQIQLAVIYTDVNVIASQDNGVNLYEIKASTVIDPTWAQSISGIIVASATAY